MKTTKTMKYWNSSMPVTIPSELLADDAFDSAGERPERVTLPPYAVVDVKTEYGLRRRGPVNGHALDSVVQQLSGGRMQPHDDESKELYATTCVDQLPHVMLAHAKSATGNDSTNVVTAAQANAERERKLNEEFGRRTRAALGEQEEAAKPKANVVFTVDPR